MINCFLFFEICCQYIITIRYPGVVLTPSLPACDLHGAIQDCFAVVNSSSSEGMASAILEVSLVLPQTAR